jgi:hypothetical protein
MDFKRTRDAISKYATSYYEIRRNFELYDVLSIGVPRQEGAYRTLGSFSNS